MVHIVILIGGLIWAIITLFSGWIFYMAWQAFVDMKDNFNGLKTSFERLQKEQSNCQAELPKTYATWEALFGPEGAITEIKKDRVLKWREQEILNRSREHDITRIKTKLNIDGD